MITRCEQCSSTDATTQRTDVALRTTCHACGHVATTPRPREAERSGSPDAADVTRPASPTTTREAAPGTSRRRGA